MDERRVEIASDVDILHARQEGRSLAAALGFSTADQSLIATAISELARNILAYAGAGEILLARAEQDGIFGIEVVARDEGPGIADVTLAMQDGYSTGGGLGLGLPGSRRLMDDFTLTSARGCGTTVTARKWRLE